MWRELRERAEWKFFAILPRADRRLAVAWWAALLLRGLLPVVFAVAMGALVAAVQRGNSLAAPLATAGAVFILLQVLVPVHLAISRNLGSRVARNAVDFGIRFVTHLGSRRTRSTVHGKNRS